MKMGNSYIRRLAGAFFLSLFVLLYANSVLFTHTHFNGPSVVTHAHPFSHPDHSHSAQEMQWLSLISVFHAVEPSPALLPAAIFVLIARLLAVYVVRCETLHPGALSARAPPVSVLF